MRNSGKAAIISILTPLFAFSSSGLAQDRARATDENSARPAVGRSSDWRTPLIGRLANGVRFAILPRKGNDPGVGLLMRNEGGFIAEHRAGERGLAHLIEHIAFHSPTTAAPDDLDHLKRIGLPLTFPAANAGSTSWRETNYYLSTKTTASSDLDALLTLLKDAASGMNLRTDAVDTSRGEVVREMADKKLGNQIYASYIGQVAPGSPNDVIDAQNSDDVPIASITTIRGLYRRLYRPANMMIVIVGNVKVDEVRSLIERRFGDWKPIGPPSRKTPFPVFQPNRIHPISFSALPEGRRTAFMTVVMPTPRPPSSRAIQARAEIMDLLVTRAINDRLAALQPSSSPGKVGIFIENGEQGHRQIMLWDNFVEDRWKPAVAGLRNSACDLVTKGFTTKEWAAAKQNLVVDLEHQVAEMPMAANVEIAKDLSHALADGRHLIPPDELLRYARTMLPQIDGRSGGEWWRQQWSSGTGHLRVEAPELARIENTLSAIRSAANGPSTIPTCKYL
ncbi:insulinase family protein [Sphingomonas sp. CFBP 13603]|uniref:M16 family metallopeptidase n=1 Tax=Sphingomonas sp. CFBP 13603 TaxID=2774040 RepID=UPI00186906C9|nr:insulinase family protein [Sphingomonas sp. CFBP 13603]MBE2994203.1 insulinase family protein [Sphingomonas sp. CFBP 13603]